MFKLNGGYENNLRQYNKKDGIFAFILFFIVMLSYSILGALVTKFSLFKNNILITGSIFNVIIILIVILFVKINKQDLDTIGLYKGKWKISCIVGIILACVYFANNCLSYLINGSNLISIKEIGILSIYYLLISVSEEIVFRGYIGTRMNGIIKKKWISVLFVALLFITMHFPYRMIAYGMTINELITNFSWIIDLFITHIIFNFIYMKTNSLYGSIIPHWISNLSYSIVSR